MVCHSPPLKKTSKQPGNATTHILSPIPSIKYRLYCPAWYLTSDATTRRCMLFFQTGRLLTVNYMTSISSFLVEIKQFSLKSD